MFGGDCTARILLDPNKKQYYVTGDVVSGVIDLHTSSMYSITDVQVKLRCDEYSVATYYTESDRRRAKRERNAQKGGLIAPLRRAAQQQALKQLGKAGNFDEDTMQIVGDGLKMLRERKKHYQLTTNAFSTAPDEDKTMLSQGHHTYPFSFRLSESINNCPPHAPVSASHGLKTGVFWTVKAVVRRPGRFQADIREVIKVPVYPENPHRDHIDFRKMKSISESAPGGAGGITAHLTYPEAGIAQDGRPIPFSIEATADGKYDIEAVKLSLTQTCVSKAKGFKETHQDDIELASGRRLRLANETVDLAPYMGRITFDGFIAPSLSLSNTNISYELVLTIVASKNPVVLRRRITVLSPADTAPPSFSSDRMSSAEPPEYRHLSDSASSSSLTPTANSHTLPSKPIYESIGQASTTSHASSHSQSSEDLRTEKEKRSSVSNVSSSEKERDYKPPLPPREPVDAPPYPRRPPRHTSAEETQSSSTVSDFRGSTATLGLSGGQHHAADSETWYPGMPVAVHDQGYAVNSNLNGQPTGNTSMAIPHIDSVLTGSTDSTLVEPADSLAYLEIEENANRHAAGDAGTLPTYEDVIGSGRNAQP